MPELTVVRGADRIKGGEVGLVIMDGRLAADHQVFAPAGVGNVVVIHDRNNVGLLIVRPEQAEVAPLDAVPADGVGQLPVILLLLPGVT